MFYRTDAPRPDALRHNPFNAIITPRPIGWISTRGSDGMDNIAPYSFFNGVAYVPPQVMFASTGDKPDRGDTKDSAANVRDTGVFCVNIVEFAARDDMNKTSTAAPRGTDEFALAGIERVACETIPCARVATAPAALECRLNQVVKLAGDSNFLIIGEVTGIHLRDDCLRDGIFDVLAYNPLSRLGYRDYTVVRDVFSLARPDD
ncbi:MAG: flavin reductase family protein [Pseudomonadota bacterium]